MRQRLFVAAVLGGLAVLLALGVVVLRFGRFDPSPPSLQDHPVPAIPGQIAYFSAEGCIMRVAASGVDHEQLYCLAVASGVPPFVALTWLDATTIGFLDGSNVTPKGGFGAPQAELVRLDVRSKTVQRTGTFYDLTTLGLDSNRRSPAGDDAVSDGDGRITLVRDGQRTEIARFDVAEYRGPEVLGWSPDGNWLLLRYYVRDGNRSELWILSRDGQTKGTLVTDAGGGPGASWWIDGAGAWPKVSLPGQ